MDESTTSLKDIVVDAEAFEAGEFYAHNYTRLAYAELGSEDRHIVIPSKPRKCRFCHGEPPRTTFRNDAHAVPELVGNKSLLSPDECDDCGNRHSRFEDDLGKMTLPGRAIGGVLGKRGVPTLVSERSGEAHQAKIKLINGTLEISHDAGHSQVAVDELARTVAFKYVDMPYRPLGAYKALCKSAFALLPHDELIHFEELRQWLIQEDLKSDQVYADGCHICYTTFVPAFRPFPRAIVALHKRKLQTDAFYMSFFIAFGNVSYQIFPPCPAKDGYLRGKAVNMPPFPHIYQLQPWLISVPIKSGPIDLTSSDRTKKRTRTISWKYEQKIKVE